MSRLSSPSFFSRPLNSQHWDSRENVARPSPGKNLAQHQDQLISVTIEASTTQTISKKPEITTGPDTDQCVGSTPANHLNLCKEPTGTCLIRIAAAHLIQTRKDLRVRMEDGKIKVDEPELREAVLLMLTSRIRERTFGSLDLSSGTFQWHTNLLPNAPSYVLSACCAHITWSHCKAEQATTKRKRNLGTHKPLSPIPSTARRRQYIRVQPFPNFYFVLKLEAHQNTRFSHIGNLVLSIDTLETFNAAGPTVVKLSITMIQHRSLPREDDAYETANCDSGPCRRHQLSPFFVNCLGLDTQVCVAASRWRPLEATISATDAGSKLLPPVPYFYFRMPPCLSQRANPMVEGETLLINLHPRCQVDRRSALSRALAAIILEPWHMENGPIRTCHACKTSTKKHRPQRLHAASEPAVTCLSSPLGAALARLALPANQVLTLKVASGYHFVTNRLRFNSRAGVDKDAPPMTFCRCRQHLACLNLKVSLPAAVNVIGIASRMLAMHTHAPSPRTHWIRLNDLPDNGPNSRRVPTSLHLPPQVMHRTLQTAGFQPPFDHRCYSFESHSVGVFGLNTAQLHRKITDINSSTIILIFASPKRQSNTTLPDCSSLQVVRFALRPHSPQAVSVPSFIPQGQIPQSLVIHTSSSPDPRPLKLYDSRRWQTVSCAVAMSTNHQSRAMGSDHRGRHEIVMSADSVLLRLPLGCSEAQCRNELRKTWKRYEVRVIVYRSQPSTTTPPQLPKMQHTAAVPSYLQPARPAGGHHHAPMQQVARCKPARLMATSARQKVGIDIDGSLSMSLSDPSAAGALPDGLEDAPLILETSMEQFPTLFSSTCVLALHLFGPFWFWLVRFFSQPETPHYRPKGSLGRLGDTTERSVTSIGRSESPWRETHGRYCAEFDFCLDCDSPTRRSGLFSELNFDVSKGRLIQLRRRTAQNHLDVARLIQRNHSVSTMNGLPAVHFPAYHTALGPADLWWSYCVVSSRRIIVPTMPKETVPLADGLSVLCGQFAVTPNSRMGWRQTSFSYRDRVQLSDSRVVQDSKATSLHNILQLMIGDQSVCSSHEVIIPSHKNQQNITAATSAAPVFPSASIPNSKEQRPDKETVTNTRPNSGQLPTQCSNGLPCIASRSLLTK
ncbi:uncharacterized protein CLUP02_08922 [Colletotrichum lupini]|uniref:Uncharacterized protein n=1 Tax=Colletotrichum lupini TaxID=145971 RepID=A0A9Q8STS1_9PEZI|nr:uncharacterized protein CLUP02_08922 [Colletotrichum lupini]UQC83427.1 hypothetical protein CLUP02_08922 [Colletotrichum lupini]